MNIRPVLSRCLAASALSIVLAVNPGCAANAHKRVSIIDEQRVDTPDIPMGDPATIKRIINIAKHDSRVMDHLTHICTTFGPRLTGSTACENANLWARDQFEKWGLANARVEPWGTVGVRFDRLESTGELVSRKRGADKDGETPEWQTDRTLEFTTLAWTRGTEGPVTGPVVKMPASPDDVDPEKLDGAWVLLPAGYGSRRGVRSIGFSMRERLDLRHSIRTGTYDPFNDPEPETWTGAVSYEGDTFDITFLPERDESGDIIAGRIEMPNVGAGPITDVTLEEKTLRLVWPNDLEDTEIELTIDGDNMTGKADGEHDITLKQTVAPDDHALTREDDRVLARVLEANPAGFISASLDERVWTTRPNKWKDISIDDIPADIEINVRRSDYDAINSRLADGQEVFARFNLHHELIPGPITVYNTIAQLPGTTCPDEVVIVSAHLDSWNGPGSQGTTDNGTGSSVVLEAARLLTQAHARPDRTIRFILWTGEEQGLWGSRKYVESLPEEERAKISAVFVDDGGTNSEGGLPAADAMVDYLAAATAPVNDVFYSETDGRFLNVNIRPTGDKIKTHGGSDHASFNKVGVPGFFWDEIGRAEYGKGWHTQNDRLDLAIPEYLIQSSACMAITAYNLANAPGLLPRLPEQTAEISKTDESQSVARSTPVGR